MEADAPELKENEAEISQDQKSASSEAQETSASDDFSDLKEGNVEFQPKNLDFLLDVPLQVSVEMGRTRMIINDLLKLNKGSVIELTQMVDEPLNVLINGKLVAKGEVVVNNERFGVKISDIASPAERIKSLR